MTGTAQTPRDFSVDKYENFQQVFEYNQKHLFSSRPFIEGEGRTLTYGRLFDLTARFAGWCAQKKLARGDRAVIISHDDMAVASLFMGCLRFGLTAVILNPEGGTEELQTLMRAAKPAAVFMDRDILARLGKPAGAIEMPITAGAAYQPPSFFAKLAGKKSKEDVSAYPGLMTTVPAATEFTPVPTDTTAYILFTSGTTSRPKGVEISHGNLLAQMKTFVRHYGYTMHSRLLNVLPLHHTDGLTQGPVAAFTAGATVCRPLRFSIAKLPDLLTALYRLRISHFIAVPTMLQLIDSLGEVRPDTFANEHFKFVISTAGYLDPNLWERFENRFGVMVVNVYGLTETVCEALYCGPTQDTRRLGTIGKPVDTECLVVNDKGEAVKDGETGELWVKGPHIMKGYFEMPAETAEVLTPDGWFKTGDLCKRDTDGFYHIVGRKKNVIIVGGINIYPDDVANILRTIPGVLDAAVWGEQDPVWGETVAAAIVLKKDAANMNADTVGAEFMKRAAAEMAPRQIHVVDDFPRGPAGKVIVRDLRAKIAGKQNTQAQMSETDIMSRVITLAAKSFKCPADSLSLDSKAETTKGWNSLAHVEFLLSLEKEFGIRIGPKEILGVRSLDDARKIVESKKMKAA